MARPLPIAGLCAFALLSSCGEKDPSAAEHGEPPSPNSDYNPRRMWERVVIGRCAGSDRVFDPARAGELADPLRGMRAGAAATALPAIQIGRPSIAGPLDPAAAEATLWRYASSLRLCAARFAPETRPAAIALELSVARDGEVTAARAGAPGRLGSCLARVSKKMRFVPASQPSRLEVACTLLGPRRYDPAALRNGLLGARAALRRCVRSKKPSRPIAEVTIGPGGALSARLTAIEGESLDPGLRDCAEAALGEQIARAPGPGGPIRMRCPLALGRTPVTVPPMISIRRGKVWVNGEPVASEKLAGALEAAARPGSAHAVLRPDSDTPYRELFGVAQAARRRFAGLIFERDVASAWVATHVPELPPVLVPRSARGIDRVSLVLESGGGFAVRAGPAIQPVHTRRLAELLEALRSARVPGRFDLGITAAPEVIYHHVGQAIIVAKRAGFTDIELLPPAGRKGHHH